MKLWRRLAVLGLPLLLLLGVHQLSQRYSTALPAQVLRLDQAAIEPAESDTPPGPAADQPRQRLPMQIGAEQAAGPLWFSFDFSLDAAAQQPYWLNLQHRPAASAYLDGALLAQSG
ncbi:MAG: hypothetical protein ABW005_12265, partial [Burkholderiaceae bacterium]